MGTSAKLEESPWSDSEDSLEHPKDKNPGFYYLVSINSLVLLHISLWGLNHPVPACALSFLCI